MSTDRCLPASWFIQLREKYYTKQWILSCDDQSIDCLTYTEPGRLLANWVSLGVGFDHWCLLACLSLEFGAKFALIWEAQLTCHQNGRELEVVSPVPCVCMCVRGNVLAWEVDLSSVSCECPFFGPIKQVVLLSRWFGPFRLSWPKVCVLCNIFVAENKR